MCESDSRQASALDEMEISPEMVEAGVSAFLNVAEIELVDRPDQDRVERGLVLAFSEMLGAARSGGRL